MEGKFKKKEDIFSLPSLACTPIISGWLSSDGLLLSLHNLESLALFTQEFQVQTSKSMNFIYRIYLVM
jgi:hypothetical protein